MNMEAIEVVKPKKTLVQLVTELLAEMEATEGEYTPDLDKLFESVGDKVGACCAVIESLETEAEGYEARMAALKARADSRRSRARWLRGYVENCMRIAGMLDIKTRVGAALYCVHFRKSTAVRITDPAKVPEMYTRTEPAKVVVDKRKALPALRDGMAIDGLELETHEYLVLS